MKNHNHIIILLLFAILWVCEPTPYEEIIIYQFVREEVIHFREVGQDSSRSTNAEDLSFIQPKTDPRSSTS